MSQKVVRVLIAAAVLCGILLWAVSMRRDLNLVDAPPGAKAAASWELGEVETYRVSEADVWHITAKNVIREPRIDHLTDISAVITGPSGERTAVAPRGTHNNRRNVLTLEDASGVWKRPQYPLTWKTPLARWTQKGDRWTFPKGVTVIGDVYNFECRSAQMTGQKTVHATNGRIVWWSKQ